MANPNSCTRLPALCTENGAPPVVIASGTKNSKLAETACAGPRGCLTTNRSSLKKRTSPPSMRQQHCAGANIAIGHSGGKFLTERQGIPGRPGRVPDPRPDRGQRILSVGYAGTLAFLDRFTNTLLEAKYASYRAEIKEKMMIRSC